MTDTSAVSSPAPWGDDAGPIVLVHGAWVGEWSWLPLLPELQKRSDRAVYNVSLAGQGAKRHLGGPHVGLEQHVDDVVSTIEVLDLNNVTLVGHSYGGKVITQVAGRVGQRLRSVVYLDGHAPTAEDRGQPPERAAEAASHGNMLPFAGYVLDPKIFGGEAGVRWCLDRVVDQPWATFVATWHGPLPEHVSKTFIYATDNNPSRFEDCARAAAADPAWAYHEIDGPHFLMFSHPTEVAEIILAA